jgi:hypothetical protein
LLQVSQAAFVKDISTEVLRRNGRQTILNKFYYPIQYLEKNKNWGASETLEDADDGDFTL